MKSTTRCLVTLAAIVLPTVLHAQLIVNLNPATAKYDGGRIGRFVTADTLLTASGITYNIALTPTAADLSDTVLLMEIGGTGKGTGMYLLAGVPTIVIKENSSDAQVPELLPDLSFPDQGGGLASFQVIAAQSSFGALTAGVSYSLAISWNHSSSLLFGVRDASQNQINDSFTITGTVGSADWFGDKTFTVGDLVVNGVGTLTPGQTGGLSGNGAGVNAGVWDVNSGVLKPFAGTIDRALYWNEIGTVPEPSTVVLGGLGLLLWVVRSRRQH